MQANPGQRPEVGVAAMRVRMSLKLKGGGALQQ